MFERFLNPDILLSEMRRVSKKYVMVLTQNVYNLGTFIHMLFHKLHGFHWDHGYARLMRMKSLIASLEQTDIKVIETGAIDIPPWMDTWDMPMRGQLKRVMKLMGKQWEWKIDVESPNNIENSRKSTGIMSFLQTIESSLPLWFKSFQGHHLYILGSI